MIRAIFRLSQRPVKMRALAILFAAATVMVASIEESLPRVAFVLGPPFEGPHDGFRSRCAGDDRFRPQIDGHEAVSVAVTCGYDTHLSSVLAGMDWIMDNAGGEDTTVVVPRNMRGSRLVEGRLDVMRGCGMTVPPAMPPPHRAGHGASVDFAIGFFACSAMLALAACVRRTIPAARPSKLVGRRHTWDMSRRDLEAVRHSRGAW